VCGIAGFVSRSNANPKLAWKMISTLSHRGPDGLGVHAQENVALAHARLSIIDRAGGSQPMQIDGGRLWITFNGEIFNYLELRQELLCRGRSFSTRSDTEVILHLFDEYGPECVQRMNGQWAFAIWDNGRKELFLSRDRMGVRPLFYTFAEGSFLFGSEVKSIFAHPAVRRELDPAALDQIFTFWCTLPENSIFKDVKQLPPGHSAVFKDGSLEISQYWHLGYVAEGEASPQAAERASESLLDLLQDATRIRLRSDVPVGAYLSGGIDSAVTTALINRIVPDKLRTFSVAFEDEEYDESPYQLEASAFLHTQHSQVRCSYSDIANIFQQVVWHTEQPIVRTAPAPMLLLSKLVRESGFRVVLTGEGSDEILGGYDIFKEAKIRRFLARNPDSNWRPALLRRLYPYMRNIQNQPPSYLRNFFHAQPSQLPNPLFSHIPRWELTSRLKVFFSDEMAATLKGYHSVEDLSSRLPKGFERWDGFCQAQYLETAHLLPGYILSSQGDRMAMANGVEGRYPFLDYRVVEFAAKLPPTLKMKVLNEKYLLKKTATGLIPPSILHRDKQPYRAPDGKSFFQGARSEYVTHLLSAESIRAAGVFNAGAVNTLVDKFRQGRASGVKDNMALVAILSTSIVVDQFINHFGRHEGWNHSSKSFAALS
jgi:asparagine synthase (glutamine-hydrolysing)